MCIKYHLSRPVRERVISLYIPTRYHETSYGYDCGLFTNPPHERYVCLICQMVIREAHLITACGHHFCRSCLDQWLEDNDVCPICREEDTTHVPNMNMDREINGLEIHCPNPENNQDRANHKEKCSWSGELRDLQSHLAGCGYEMVTCTNKGCRVIMKRKLLAKHLQKNCCHRLVQCEHCHFDVPYWKITGEISKSSHVPPIPPIHHSECPEYPMACPNRCGVTGIRHRAMRDHHSSCPLEPLECPFKDAGCTEKIARKDMEHHMTTNQQNHMQLFFQSFQQSIQQVKQELQGTKQELQDTKYEIRNAKQELCDTKQELQDTKQGIQDTKQELQDTKKELQDTKQELQVTKQELYATKQELHDTKLELGDTKQELQDTKQELQDTKKELCTTRQELKGTKQELHATRQELQDTKEQVHKKAAELNTIGDTLTFRIPSFSWRRREKKPWHSRSFSIVQKVQVHLAVYPSGIGNGQGSHVSVSLVRMNDVQLEPKLCSVPDFDIGYTETLLFSVSVAAKGQYGSVAPQILQFSIDYNSVLSSKGQVLQTNELFLTIEEAKSLLVDDSMIVELTLLETEQWNC